LLIRIKYKKKWSKHHHFLEVNYDIKRERKSGTKFICR
jgi:hypothetical protein